MSERVTDRIFGRNPVYETLRAGRRSVARIRVAKGVEVAESLERILTEARERGVSIQAVPRSELDRESDHHQGIAADVGPYPYVTLYDILDAGRERGEAPFLLLLDALENPQNLGTLLRTAEAVGVHGVIIPPKRAAQVTHSVVSASSGACEHLLIAQENIARTAAALKQEDVWIAGLEHRPESQLLGTVDLGGPLAIVVGSEGRGMRRLVRETCDFLIKLPMRGRVDSLNAAVAGSICLYAAWDARREG